MILSPRSPSLRTVGKYDALGQWLLRAGDGPIEVSFRELDRIVPGGLPASARTHQAWWANEEVGSHVQARGWLAVGRFVERVDLNAQIVRFSAPQLRGSG
jgi:hypothetical protein